MLAGDALKKKGQGLSEYRSLGALEVEVREGVAFFFFFGGGVYRVWGFRGWGLGVYRVWGFRVLGLGFIGFRV